MKKLPASEVILQSRYLGQMITVIVDCVLEAMRHSTNIPGVEAW